MADNTEPSLVDLFFKAYPNSDGAHLHYWMSAHGLGNMLIDPNEDITTQKAEIDDRRSIARGELNLRIYEQEARVKDAQHQAENNG